MSDYYSLDGHKVVPEIDVLEWAKKFEAMDRRVAKTEVEQYTVFTSFLAIDHSFGEGPPLLFETMTYDNLAKMWVDEQERYSTWEEAEKGHQDIVDKIREGLKVK